MKRLIKSSIQRWVLFFFGLLCLLIPAIFIERRHNAFLTSNFFDWAIFDGKAWLIIIAHLSFFAGIVLMVLTLTCLKVNKE